LHAHTNTRARACVRAFVPVFVGVAVWLLEPWSSAKRQPSLADFRWNSLGRKVWTAFANSMNFSVRSLFPCSLSCTPIP
jgi:hypothetical protein